MDVLEIKEINFLGDTLMAAKDEKGKVWAGVRWICKGIGLSEDRAKYERQKIQQDLVLSKGRQNFIFPTKDGNQAVLCLQLDFIPLWLAKIAITPTMEKETPEIAEKLVNYQLKAKDVLAAAFLPQARPMTQAEIIAAQAQILVNIERSQKEIKQSLDNTNKRIDDISRSDYSRFIVIGSEEQEKKLDILVKKKGLLRTDIVLILQTLKLNPDVYSD